MLDLCGKTILERVVDRVKLSEVIDEIWIATSSESEDKLVKGLATKMNINCFQGSLTNVMSRFYETAKLAKADIIVRITADNPLTEPTFIGTSVDRLVSGSFDYVGFDNIPLGSGVEAFTMNSFAKLRNRDNLNEHNREHVTSCYYQNPEIFKIGKINNMFSESEFQTRLTVDTLEDYILMAGIYNEMLVKDIKPEKFMEYILSKKKL